MAKTQEPNEQLLCSFCGKSQRQVKKLIAGPGVYICDECIDLCNEIIDEELTGAPTFDLEKVSKDTDRDFFMSSEEAKEYGIVDRVIDSH